MASCAQSARTCIIGDHVEEGLSLFRRKDEEEDTARIIGATPSLVEPGAKEDAIGAIHRGNQDVHLNKEVRPAGIRDVGQRSNLKGHR